MTALPFLALLLRAATDAHAMDPNVCEANARRFVQGDLDAYIHLAHEYPGEPLWTRYLACEGQPLQLVESVQDGRYWTPTFHYTYSVQCGRAAFTFGATFEVRSDCQVVGG